jgi:osmotically-inducible protein OsmY
MAEPSIADQIARQLEALGVPVSVEDTGEAIVLDGVVSSEESRAAAEDIAVGLAPDRRIENNLDIDTILPVDIDNFASQTPTADLEAGEAELSEGFDDLEPDFENEPLVTDPIAASGAGSSDEDDPATELLDTYTPPSDPVITTDNRGVAEVLGGFETDDMEDIEVAPSAEDRRPGDEALADAVREELRQDAATTDLLIHVHVHHGVVRLRGRVEGPEDADNAEDVASRVPGVVDVEDELDVAAE